jgi:hypothetical protein
MNGIKFLENKMNLEQAIELVLNEAESSALGDSGENVLHACEVVQAFYEEYGYQFSNFSVDNDE